jgi:predicted RND superfamily exporter protein
MKTSRHISAMIRWRWWVLSLWLIGIVASSWVYVSTFRIDNSVAIWFLEDDPELDAYREHLSQYGEKEWTYIWLRTQSIYSPEFLKELRSLCDRIEKLEDVSRVSSLADAGKYEFGALGVPVFKNFNSLHLQQEVQRNPRFEGRVIPKDNEEYTIVAFENANKIDEIEPYRVRLLDDIREVVSDYPSVLEFGIAGTTVINAELNRAARRDMFIYYTLITAFVVIGGGLTLRRVRDVIVLCAVVLGSLLPVMGVISIFKLPFNLITVMLPTLLVTVSVSYLIHFISEFHVQRQENADTSTVITMTFCRLLRPGIWTTISTAIGFSSLILSPVAPIRHVGIFATMGIALAWVNTITVAPAFLSIFWHSEKEDFVSQKVKASRVLGWLENPHPLLALMLTVALVGGTFGLIKLDADTDYVKFFRPGNPVREGYSQLNQLGMPEAYLTVTVKLSEESGLADLDRHQSMKQFVTSLKSISGVLDVRSLDVWVEEMGTQLGVNDAKFTGTFLGLLETGNLGPTDLFLAKDGKSQQLLVMTDSLSTRDINQFRKELEDVSKDFPAEWDVALTGTNVLWANMDGYVIRTQMLSIGITVTALLILMPIALGSFFLGLAGFVVSFVPVLCTLGLMGWLGLPVNIATCLLGGVVIGLAVDDTIYFLLRVREGKRQGLSVDCAIRRATWTTGHAMIKTSLILTGGFLTMAASDFMPSVYFGIFFAFSILVALLCDLIVLPYFFRKVPGFFKSLSN